MVAVQVWYLDANLTIPVLVPVQLLLHDVELDVGGEAAEGFYTVILKLTF